MPRYVLELSYDGGDFLGWQTQPHGRTVQDVLNSAARELCNEFISTHAAGRTDRGVHARAQTVHFDTSKIWDPRRLVLALNSKLPASVSVMRAASAGEMFHARHSARLREYRYFIWNSNTCYPHIKKYVSWLPGRYDWSLCKSLPGLIEGEHDFRAFCRTADCPENPVRTINKVQIKRLDKLLIIRIVGRGFLTNMVRIIAGDIAEVARGARDAEWFRNLIEKAEPRGSSAKTLGPEGLFFWKAYYGERIFSRPDFRI